MSSSPSPSQPGTKRGPIDGTAVFFMVLAAASLAGVWWTKGPERALAAAGAGLWLLTTIAPMIALGLYLGGLARELSDPAKVAPRLGESSGWWGLALASALGAVTPGGPFAAFPIVYALFLAGADVGAVVAYLTGWSILALHRVIIWELPLLGGEFTFLRLMASLPLPILAGALARILAQGPLEVRRPEPIGRTRGDRT